MLKLTPQVYAAEVGGSLIFLDLKRDQYTYLPAEDAACIIPLLTKSPALDRQSPETDKRLCETEAVFHHLRMAGLVTLEGPGKPFKRMAGEFTLKEMPRLIGPDRPTICLGHVFHFGVSVCAATIALRILPLHWIVNRIRARRIYARHRRPHHSVTQLTEIYRRLRPLMLTKTDRCLLDSLCLINFLDRYGVSTTWRFGVQLEPFKAHAWAQHGSIILDDMAANIHNYTVILKA